MNTQLKDDKNIWLVTADMGYGHQRAVYPLKQLSSDQILTIGMDFRTPWYEKFFWLLNLKSYEFLSRIKNLPFIGEKLFKMLDFLLAIPPVYPNKNHSGKSFQVIILEKFIQSGLCKSVISMIDSQKRPLVTSFYAIAMAAEYHKTENIYCIICDSDLNRVWVSANPLQSKIKYLVPCGRAKNRLLSYGVKEENIFLTGFPLPIELLGDKNLNVLKQNLAIRLKKLDPNNRFSAIYGAGIEKFLGDNSLDSSTRPLTITFCVGGAGAQKELAAKIAKSLKTKLQKKQIRLILVAGWRSEVYLYFKELKQKLALRDESAIIIYSGDRAEYFRQFNKFLAETDILWTKPSELSFYCALGLPIILSPSIGAQERCNKSWLTSIGAGIRQEDPAYTDQWLFDLVNSGRLAEAAWSGFLKARKLGSFKIAEVLDDTFLADEEYNPLKR